MASKFWFIPITYGILILSLTAQNVASTLHGQPVIALGHLTQSWFILAILTITVLLEFGHTFVAKLFQGMFG